MAQEIVDAGGSGLSRATEEAIAEATALPESAGGDAQEARRAFLFTDIEGSTRLWERFPVAMRRALAQHDALLFAIAERHKGHVFKTIGDAFCVAFPSSRHALLAAVEAQRALASQDWGQVGHVRVRMALHEGVCEMRSDDYFGPPLNRSARLRDAGHGGQILLSAAARGDLLLSGDEEDFTAAEKPFTLDDTGGGVTLLDLGQHKLKDLSEAEHVYQVCVPGLQTEFPKLRTPSTHPNNLPSGTTSFVGRSTEARAVRDLLGRGEVRLVTLTGMGGCGKTRLALEVAAGGLEFYPQGVWYADLAPVATPSLVLPTILRACGLKPDPAQTPLEQLSRHLRDATALLVLDNLEQVADAAEDIAALLRATQRLKVVATSRTLLELSMEYEYAVPPLRAADCISLFVARAQQARPDFGLDPAIVAEVEAICERLDHLPLAVELAAAQMRSLTLAEIRGALEQSLDVLSTRMRDLSPRQRSLRGAIDWSHSLLSEEGRRLFHGLSIFAGGFTPEAATRICGPACGISAPQVPALLERLRASSLVQQGQALGRFSLLETLRQYGQELLAQESEWDMAERLRTAHRAYYLEMVETQDALMRGPQQREAREAMQADIANLRVAQDRAGAEGDIVAGARFGVALRRFWFLQGYQREGLERLQPVVQRCHELHDPALEGDLLFVAGDMARVNARFDDARRWFEESAAAFHASGDRSSEARALTGLGGVHYTRGSLAEADACYERALALRREIQDRRGEAVLLTNLALQAMARSDYARARALSEESVALIESQGDEANAPTSWNCLGVICVAIGDRPAAQRAFERCLALGEQLGIPRARTYALVNLADLALQSEDAATGERLATEALEIARQIQDPLLIAGALVSLGRAARLAGDRARAFSLCQEGLTLYRDADERQMLAIALEVLAEAVVTDSGRDASAAAAAARLFLATAQALREETGARPTPYETARIARAVARAGDPRGTTADMAAALAAAERLAEGGEA